MFKLPKPVFMADIARAMNTPPPAQEAQTPQPAVPLSPQPDLKQDFQKANAADAKRTEKNERDRLRRKAQRAAALKAAETPAPKKKAAAPKRKKKKTARIHALTNVAVAPTKKAKRRRGRPPGAKNKPKVGLAVTLVPAPGVLPRGRVTAALLADNSLLARIQQAVALLVAMPEHARKVVLDAVK